MTKQMALERLKRIRNRSLQIHQEVNLNNISNKDLIDPLMSEILDDVLKLVEFVNVYG